MSIIFFILGLSIVALASWVFATTYPIAFVLCLAGAGFLIWWLSPLEKKWKAEQERFEIRKKIRAQEAAEREAERLAAIEAEEREKMGLK